MHYKYYHKSLFKISLIIIVAAFTGCKTLQDLADAQKPNLSVENVRVTDFAFDEVELTFDVKVENPNPFALHLLSYNYDFNINENTFIEGTRDKGLDIAAEGASVIHIPVNLNFVELYNLFSNLKGQDEADYTLLADLTFNLPVLGETTIPLKKTGTIPTLQKPEIAVSGLKINDVSLTDTELELLIRVKNSNGFALLLEGVNYRLKVNNEEWLNTRFTNNIEIAQNEVGYIHIPISLNTLNIGTSIMEILQNTGDLNFSLKGTIDVAAKHPLLGDTDFSFFESGRLPVMMQ